MVMECIAPGCAEQAVSKEKCKVHYLRFYRTGQFENVKGMRTIQDAGLRWLSFIDIQPDGCWYWTGGLNVHKYGKFKVNGRTLGAHRVGWFFRHGPTEIGLDHLCHTLDKACPGGVECLHRRCVNPDHLEPCTVQENTRRRDERKR